MKKYTTQKNCSLRQFTDETYPQGSFAFFRLVRERDIKVNGVRVGANAYLNVGDEVVYYTTPKEEAAPSHRKIYADEQLFVCDKFSGVSTEALANELSQEGQVFPVHRLDRNTCGVIFFARTRAAEEELFSAFKQHRVKKTYLALCKDCFKREEATLTAYLKKDANASLVTICDSPRAGYARIVTEYKVLRRESGLSLVQIILHTGKTHQIRAHMAHIGCPVLGDEKYGDAALNKKYAARRQRLVCSSMSAELYGELAYLSGKIFQSTFSPEI